MKKIYFIGDAHFGAEDENSERIKTERLFSFLDYVESENADLVILGDLFDFWFEYKFAVPRRHFDIIARLSGLCQKGMNIHYMAGNHDFWLGSFMEKEIGLVLHPDDYTIQNEKYRIYIRHGDGLLKNDYGYRFLKRVLRSPVNIFLYRLLHPDLGIPLALFFSGLSREASRDRSHYTDVDYRGFAADRIAKGADIVILGHTHWAALESHGTGWYVNPGEWMREHTFAIIDDAGPRVLRWNGQSPEPVDIVLPPGNLENKS